MRRSIEGCRAIVTGASSGIGRAVALELARRGAKVVATARREDRLTDLEKQVSDLGGTLVPVAADITDSASRREVISRAMDSFGGLDLLVNNAGRGAIRAFPESDEAELRSLMEVNFFATVEMTRDALDSLLAGRKPMIVNIGSILGRRGIPKYSEYCASKFALQGFSESLRADLAPRGVDVLMVNPGRTATEFFDRVVGDTPDLNGGIHVAAVDSVARQIVRAIRSGKHEIVPHRQGRWLLWLNRLSPRLADALVAQR